MLEEERKKQKYGIKVHVIAKAQFDVVKEGKLVDQPSFHFPVKSVTLLRDQNIYDKIAPIFTTLDKRIQDRKDRGSGFRFGKLLHMDVVTCLYQPNKGGFYIPSPRWLSSKNASINIKSKDEKCLLDCIIAHLHPVHKDPQRPSHYEKYRHEINVEGVEFPAGLTDMKRLEVNNPQLCLNVYAMDPKSKKEGQQRQEIVFYLYRISDNRGDDKVCINLLLMEDEKSEKRHFVLIKDSARLTHRSFTKHKAKSFVCPFCLVHFMRQDLLDTHFSLCRNQKPVTVQYPTKGKDDILQFKAYEKTMEKEYYIIFNYETYERINQNVEAEETEKLPENTPRPFPWVQYANELSHAKSCNTCSATNPCQKIKQSTTKLAHLEAFSFAYKVVGKDGPTRLYQGPDCHLVMDANINL